MAAAVVLTTLVFASYATARAESPLADAIERGQRDEARALIDLQ